MTFDEVINLTIHMDHKYKNPVCEYLDFIFGIMYLNIQYFVDQKIYPMTLICALIGTKFYLRIEDVEYLRLDVIYFYENGMLDNVIKSEKKINTLNQKTYLILDKNTKLVKIGKSNNPIYRERTLQS